MILRLLAGLALAVLCSGTWGATVVLSLSERAPAYEAFVRAFAEHFRDPAHALVLRYPDPLTPALPADTRLVIAVGSRAADALLTTPLPADAEILLALVTRPSYERVARRLPLKGGVLIDQPAARYIRLVRTTFPDVHGIGLLSGADSQDTVQALARAAREAGLRVHDAAVRDEDALFPALQRVVGDASLLLATPDTHVFNARTIPAILLSAFRRKIPVVGFSPAYVNAGAVVALYSSPEQIARQSVALARDALAGKPPAGMQYPREFSVGVNGRVARALELQLDDENILRERIESQEQPP
ncbi:MAG: ABC transporter substrate binding protein [Candidatus Dactylopiibacterium sp.]|nr:ABC transporter substrate binding protein [Candidatus Dactylopiibacterium sp.]